MTRVGLRNDRLKGSHVERASRIGGEVEDLQYLVRQPDVKGGESGKSVFGARRVNSFRNLEAAIPTFRLARVKASITMKIKLRPLLHDCQFQAQDSGIHRTQSSS